MTSRTTEIQRLIADIEGLLVHKGKRLHRVLAQEQDAREILEKIRAFLVSLQESNAVRSLGESDDEQQLSPLLARFVNQSSQLSPGEEAQTPGELGISPRTELGTLLEPLKLEMQTLLQERAKLVEEIRHLEQKRLQNYSLAQQVANQERMISEFLQVLMNRIRPGVNYKADAPQQDFGRQVGQEVEQKALPEFSAASSSTASSDLNPEALIVSSAPALSDSLDQLQQLTRLTGDLDHRLLALDSTVNAVFNALERNILTYHDSLSQSLSRMHSKGVQGETLLTNLIDNLSQHLRSDNTIQNASQNETKLEDRNNFTNVDSLVSPTEDIQSSTLMTSNNTDAGIVDSTDSIPDLDSILLNLNRVENDTTDPLPVNKIHENSARLEFEDTQTVEHKSQDKPQNQISASNDVDELYASLFGPGDIVDTAENINSQDSTRTLDNITDEERSIEGTNFDSYTVPGIDTSSHETATVSGEEKDSKAITEINLNISDGQNENVADITERLTVEGNLLASTPKIELPVEPEETFLGSDTEENIPSLSIESAISDTDLERYESQNPVKSLPDIVTAEEVMEDMWNTFPLEENTDIEVEETKGSEESIVTESIVNTDTLSSDTSFKSDITPDSTQVPESEAIPGRENIPKGGDTIAALTDLLPELGIQGDMFEVETFTQDQSIQEQKGQGPLDSVHPAENQEQTSSSILEEAEKSDDYLPASPEEDLLTQEQAAIDRSNLEISLNPEQRQQLNRDLNNFDAEQAPQPQVENHPESNTPLSTSAKDLPKLEISAWETPPGYSDSDSDPNLTEKCADTQLDLSPTLGLTEEISTQNITSSDIQSSDLQANDLSSGTANIDPAQVDDKVRNSIWYLGVDLGTTGISAVLLNRSTQEVYPLYWSAPSQPPLNSVQRSFRLPSEVYLPSSTVASEKTSVSSPDEAAEKQPRSPALDRNLFSAYLKPYLQVALPYKNHSEISLNKGRQKWEPLLQLNELSTIPLVWVVRSLSKLLLTFKSDRKSTTLGLTAAADGLPSETFDVVINNLAGVICTCPSNSSEQYRFNVREALLTSKLVQHPQQVFFVEEAVAGLLSELDGARGEIVKFKGSKRSLFPKSNSQTFIGNTLIVNIGASATEMGLVDIPQNLHELTHNKFMLHNFFYAGKAIEQDIVCQLLVPEKWRESRFSKPESASTQSSTSWKPSVPGLEQMRLSSLGLDKLELPRPGEADIKARIRLQQRLESSVLGQAILNAAGALKLILQQQESFQIELADQRWVLQRRDLESQVFVPFVRRLNREINRLLVARGIPTEAVDQAILTGGVASLGSVSRWLHQKLPNAKIIQDSYLGEDNTPKCTRVAYGLALLTLHPQVLEIPRQQYTDYFLFTELLQLLPQRAVSFGELIQLFEGRGINTRSCQQRLLAFLEGELPQGLIPEAENSQWITQGSLENPYYKAIATAPLFEKQGSLTYRPNLGQLERLRRYLDVIQASTQQSLKEPYTVNFVVGVQKE